jgi:23S rRNA pseudouridine1911/1915/1917 synthase
MKTKQYYIENLNVLYEDNHLIVIEKPINILSQKDETNDFDINEIVKDYLKEKYQKQGNVYLGLVHRLDRRVGGVLVLAKTSKAASRLSEDIRGHKFQKEYIALCDGKLSSGTYEDLLIKDEKSKLAKIDKKGKEAKLEYKLINCCIINNKPHSYVLVNLITGRYNQIRCQMSYHKHPLINDYKYGYMDSSKKSEIGLWCYKITITHPVTKEVLTFKKIPSENVWSYLDRSVL